MKTISKVYFTVAPVVVAFALGSVLLVADFLSGASSSSRTLACALLSGSLFVAVPFAGRGPRARRVTGDDGSFSAWRVSDRETAWEAARTA